jgi:hypothetical protein
VLAGDATPDTEIPVHLSIFLNVSMFLVLKNRRDNDALI